MTKFGSIKDPAIVGDRYRITPITSRVVRLEWSPSGAFEDRPTTFAVRRDLPTPAVRSFRKGDRLVLQTEHYRLEYDEGPFSTNGLRLDVLGGVSAYHSVWRYGQDLSLPAHVGGRAEGVPTRVLDGNLGGAARTLDEADGPVPLEPGINSTVGYAVIDDSASMVFDSRGQLLPREAEDGYEDLYVFATGHDHVEGLRDFFAISGPQPILPRFALGNWWSRFHRYREESYLELMDQFRDRGVPLSVAVIDMDWHLTDIDPKFGSGWTGYTWNRDLFPDPQRFQEALHERGMAVTLNVHPADGVRAFEDAYGPLCHALGREPDGEPIAFDATDREFLKAYFDVLHRDLEKQGTDFWWVDWQSGPYSKVAGMDPLWILNQGHFEDNRCSDHRPLTLSRYAGPGSHRYPVGFSGDSVISWDSLAFQPRFTAAAANIGYGWWSHDIGGHMEGYRDDELAARWVQFGVFSPIMRLHSGNSRFGGKEPWRYAEAASSAMVEHLRLRHRMLPYLHTMNRRAHLDGRLLVEPVYFEDHSPEAYSYLDQYLFGSELLVAPIVQPAAKDVARAAIDVWLPEGRWIDIFTGWSYRGGRLHQMHRSLDSVPVLLRAGGILPLVGEHEDLSSHAAPAALEVLVAAGADGSFTLWEEGPEAGWTATDIELEVAAGSLTLRLPEPSASQEERQWTLRLLGFDDAAFGDLAVRGARIAVREPSTGATVLDISPEVGTEEITLRSVGFSTTGRNDIAAGVEELLKSAQIGFSLKDQIYDAVTTHGVQGLASLAALGTRSTGHSPVAREYEQASPALISAVTELVSAE